MESKLLQGVLATLIYGGLGIALTMLGYKAFDWITAWNTDEEIRKGNVATAIVAAAIVVGVSIIVAAAISG